jgi:hypothetical protein
MSIVHPPTIESSAAAIGSPMRTRLDTALRLTAIALLIDSRRSAALSIHGPARPSRGGQLGQGCRTLRSADERRGETLELENFGIEPVRLTEVQIEK